MGRKKDVAGRDRGFQLYAKHNRNQSAVSRELGVPVQTIAIWKKQEDWDSKLDAIQAKLREEYKGVPTPQEIGVVNEKISDLDLLGLLFNKLKAALEGNEKDEEIKIRSWKDVMATLDFIQKEKRIILGEATNNSRPAIEAESLNEEQLDNKIRGLQEFLSKHGDGTTSN